MKNHENVSLFLSGHQFEDFDQFKYHLDTGVNGNRVHELLVDPQNMANGGNGWIVGTNISAADIALYRVFGMVQNPFSLCSFRTVD